MLGLKAVPVHVVHLNPAGTVSELCATFQADESNRPSLSYHTGA
jgi:hypothetical protein